MRRTGHRGHSRIVIALRTRRRCFCRCCLPCSPFLARDCSALETKLATARQQLAHTPNSSPSPLLPSQGAMTSTAAAMLAGPRYGPKVRIGNWSEDEARFALASRDYEAKRSRGELLHLRKAAEKAFQVQRVPVAYAEDGVVRYGVGVQVGARRGAASTRVLLACNVHSTVRPGFIRVTGAAAGEEDVPQARNVFLLQPCRPGKDDVVRYGDRVRVVSHPALTVDPATKVVGVPYTLHSQRANNVLGAGRKGWQDVTMCQVANADTEWVIQPTGDAPGSGAGDDGALEGDPIRAGQEFQLLHAMTNQCLAADAGVTTPTDFGVELEVHALTYRRAAHASMSAKGELPPTAAQEGNRWHFVLGADASAAAAGPGDDAAAMKTLTVDTVLDKARAALTAACSIHGLRSLSLALASLDERASGQVPVDLVRVALVEHGVLLPDAEMALLLTSFTHARYILRDEFLAALRSDTFTPARAEAISAAWASLQLSAPGRAAAAAASAAAATARPGATARSLTATSVGASTARATGTDGVTIADLKASFDAKFDPRALAKVITVVEAASEFGRQWPLHTRPTAVVTEGDFAAYYRDVAACMPDDFEFVTMVANVWHVPGRGGWKTKAGKRVLVTFHAGSSTEVVIPEAEDIPDDDFVGLTTALKAMGFGGIARVKVLGAVDA